MKVLQITDPHLYGNSGASLRGVQTEASLRGVLDEALAADDDYALILATGDLVQDDPWGYLRFKSILGALEKPVLCVPGNHDDPEIMRRTLAHEPFQHCGSREFGAWNFIMLDSCDPGHAGGRLRAGELARLDAALTQSSAHALVCLHHHPVAMGSRWLDGIGLVNAEAFWRVIDAHAHVRGVMWGHVHQPYDGARHGVTLLGTPSTCAQFAPQSEHYAIDSRPPAYRHLELGDDGCIRSEVRWVAPVPRQAEANAAGGRARTGRPTS